MSIAKGIVKTAENVVKMNADTMQIFSRNPRGSNYKDPTVKEAGVSEDQERGRFWSDSGACTLYDESGECEAGGV